VIQAVQELFANVALRRLLFRTRYLIGLLLLVPLALTMKPALLPYAFAISMTGQLVQTWCFAALVKNRELTARGPYLLSRNPMYLGRYLLLLGFVLLPGNLWLVLAFTVLYYLYMVSRVRREEVRLRRNFGEDYARYCREVRRFLPSIGRLNDPAVWFFDRETFLENHAHWNLLGTLGAYAILFVIAWRQG
jgi:protein-S-isoprenylcysteine O-methyltransferase Ste14